MNIIAAVDSLKGSLTSLEAGQAVKEGILSAIPEARVWVRPVADGGEGTVDALVSGMGGEIRNVSVTGPLGEPVQARYGILTDTAATQEGVRTAVLEMAEAAGLPLVPVEKRNPMKTTTYGVGEMIIDALEQGCRSFIVGIGGSATNDAGFGMLRALGFEFYKKNGEPVLETSDLAEISRVEKKNINPLLKECRFQVICDVTNPLCGKNGASYVFGPQKGADSQMAEALEGMLLHFAEVTEEYLGENHAEKPGAGAAGGMGFAFLAYLYAELKSGVDVILDTVISEEDLRRADVVVTGEGRFDAQTAMGKAPAGIAKRAKKYGCKVFVLAGSVAEETMKKLPEYVDAAFSIQTAPVELKEAMRKEIAARNMSYTAEQVFRLLG